MWMGDVAMCDDDIKFAIGELTAKLESIEKKLDHITTDVDELKSYKAHLVGIGASVSFFLAAIGFMFGDIMRSMIRKMFN
jgi:hypothetical protein